MSNKINEHGCLEVESVGPQLIEQQCPTAWRPENMIAKFCGSWCPAFIEKSWNYDHERKCNGACNEVQLVCFPGQPVFSIDTDERWPKEDE